MIEKASSDFIPNVIKRIPFLIEILQKADANNQSIICSLFCSIFSRADHDCVSEQMADNFMITVIQIMNSRNNLLEEAVEAIGLLAENIDSKFEKYIQSVIPLLI